MKTISSKLIPATTVLALLILSAGFAAELFSSGTEHMPTSHKLCVQGVICVDTNYPVLLDDGTILDHSIPDDGRKIVKTLPYPITYDGVTGSDN